jgi:HlyD family secretion protein
MNHAQEHMMKTKLLWAVLVAALLGLSVWALMPEPMVVEVASVRVARFERYVQEDGKTQLRERYVVSSPLQARLARLPWKPGDRVQRGTVLAKLWPVSPALLDARAQDSAQARVGVAQAGVLRAQAGQARAGAAAQQADQERARQLALAQAGFVSPTQTEAAVLAAQLRLQELRSAEQDVQASQQELLAAQAALKFYPAVAAPLGGTKQNQPWPVLAPVTGTVLKVLQASEDVVQAGQALLELGDPQALEVVVDVLTQEAAQIAPGAVALLDPWAGGAVLHGRVRLVEPSAFTKVSALGVQEQRVNVLIDLDPAPDQQRGLGDGFRVAVRILVQAQDQALLVPVSALFGQGADAGLFVLDGERVRRQGVEVLARNGVDAWVRSASALKPGTQVVVYPPAALQADGRVKVMNRR